MMLVASIMMIMMMAMMSRRKWSKEDKEKNVERRRIGSDPIVNGSGRQNQF